MTEVRYPNVTVELVGQDGNALAIVAAVRQAMRRGGVSQDEQDAFMKEALSGDYDHLLQTVLRWVEVD